MDYLVSEGYKSAAEEFSKEADITAPVEFSSIETRMNIREAVHRGDVEEAIELVNDLDPEVSFRRFIPIARSGFASSSSPRVSVLRKSSP